MAFSVISPVKTWKARHSNLYFTLSDRITIAAATPLHDLFSTAAANAVASSAKNVTVTPPTTDVEKVDLLGLDTNRFQNALLDNKPPGLATITGTLLLGEDETLEATIVSGSTAVTGPPASTRYQYGKDRDLDTNIAILCNMQEFGQASRVSFCMVNAKITKFGDVKISGADGHWEQDFTAVCLPKDFYWEYID